MIKKFCKALISSETEKTFFWQISLAHPSIFQEYVCVSRVLHCLLKIFVLKSSQSNKWRQLTSKQGIPAFHQVKLSPAHPPPAVITKNVSGQCQLFPGGKTSMSWNSQIIEKTQKPATQPSSLGCRAQHYSGWRQGVRAHGAQLGAFPAFSQPDLRGCALHKGLRADPSCLKWLSKILKHNSFGGIFLHRTQGKAKWPTQSTSDRHMPHGEPPLLSNRTSLRHRTILKCIGTKGWASFRLSLEPSPKPCMKSVMLMAGHRNKKLRLSFCSHFYSQMMLENIRWKIISWQVLCKHSVRLWGSGQAKCHGMNISPHSLKEPTPFQRLYSQWCSLKDTSAFQCIKIDAVAPVSGSRDAIAREAFCLPAGLCAEEAAYLRIIEIESHIMMFVLNLSCVSRPTLFSGCECLT